MAITRLIAAGTFGPEDIAIMTTAYEAALVVLRLDHRDDPVTELVAKTIISIVGQGERDPATVANRAIAELNARRKP